MRNLRTADQHEAGRQGDVRVRVVSRGTPQAQQGSMVGEAGAACQESSAVRGVVRKTHWKITDHAANRYRQRCPGKRGLSLVQAGAELALLLERAHFVKVLTSGLELWRGGLPWRLRYRARVMADGSRELVTVLRGCDAGVR